MRPTRSSQKDLKDPGAEKSPYTPGNIFKLSNIARDGPNRMKDKPLPIARRLIERGIRAIKNWNTRVSEVWGITTGFDDWRLTILPTLSIDKILSLKNVIMSFWISKNPMCSTLGRQLNASTKESVTTLERQFSYRDMARSRKEDTRV